MRVTTRAVTHTEHVKLISSGLDWYHHVFVSQIYLQSQSGQPRVGKMSVSVSVLQIQTCCNPTDSFIRTWRRRTYCDT